MDYIILDKTAVINNKETTNFLFVLGINLNDVDVLVANTQYQFTVPYQNIDTIIQDVNEFFSVNREVQ